MNILITSKFQMVFYSFTSLTDEYRWVQWTTHLYFWVQAILRAPYSSRTLFSPLDEKDVYFGTLFSSSAVKRLKLPQILFGHHMKIHNSAVWHSSLWTQKYIHLHVTFSAEVSTHWGRWFPYCTQYEVLYHIQTAVTN